MLVSSGIVSLFFFAARAIVAVAFGTSIEALEDKDVIIKGLGKYFAQFETLEAVSHGFDDEKGRRNNIEIKIGSSKSHFLQWTEEDRNGIVLIKHFEMVDYEDGQRLEINVQGECKPGQDVNDEEFLPHEAVYFRLKAIPVDCRGVFPLLSGEFTGFDPLVQMLESSDTWHEEQVQFEGTKMLQVTAEHSLGTFIVIVDEKNEFAPVLVGYRLNGHQFLNGERLSDRGISELERSFSFSSTDFDPKMFQIKKSTSYLENGNRIDKVEVRNWTILSTEVSDEGIKPKYEIPEGAIITSGSGGQIEKRLFDKKITPVFDEEYVAVLASSKLKAGEFWETKRSQLVKYGILVVEIVGLLFIVSFVKK